MLPAAGAPVSAAPAEDNNPRIIFPPATLNGQPVTLIWDSGSFLSWLRDDTARRLGLNIVTPPDVVADRLQGSPVGFTDPVRLALGKDASFTAPLLVLPWNSSTEVHFDGCIGWAETKDNILVFDPGRRTVTRVERLPPETTNWFKLKIYPYKILALELPLPPGRPGVLLVDTGSVHGVSLSPFRWFLFKRDHPAAPINNTAFFGVTGPFHRPQSWADELVIGPFTLTSVPVIEASDYEIGGLDDYYGTLGLDALTRLDLVVDGPGGYAYLQPRPAVKTPAGSPAPAAVETQDWRVIGALQISTGALYAQASEGHANLGTSRNNNHDFEGAIAEYNRALELDPKNSHAQAGLAMAYVNRAISKSRNGDRAGARADVNRALELDPQNTHARSLLDELGAPAAK
ncbi:MAG TPA: hypothetical protein VHC95_02380 [Opitutales bacterium]|nr:hypothetical protein [Opitutales bacterium]